MRFLEQAQSYTAIWEDASSHPYFESDTVLPLTSSKTGKGIMDLWDGMSGGVEQYCSTASWDAEEDKCDTVG